MSSCSARRLAVDSHSGTATVQTAVDFANNTNPILDEASAEHAKARDNGVEVGFDGMSFEV